MEPFTRPTPRGDCRRIIIVGAGGFGREVLQWARDAWPDRAEKIAGFLSSDPEILAGRTCSLPIIADPARFEPQAGDAFLLGIGIPGVRRRVAEDLIDRGAAFLTLIHPTAIVADTAAIGTGTIICPYAIVSDAVRLGRFTLLNYHASLGHDAAGGEFAVFSPYSALGGGSSVGDDAFMGMHATAAPGVPVGHGSKISANSSAHAAIPRDSLVFGVPGRIAPLLSSENGRSS